jgi:hypothetical protein
MAPAYPGMQFRRHRGKIKMTSPHIQEVISGAVKAKETLINKNAKF